MEIYHIQHVEGRRIVHFARNVLTENQKTEEKQTKTITTTSNITKEMKKKTQQFRNAKTNGKTKNNQSFLANGERMHNIKLTSAYYTIWLPFALSLSVITYI